MALGDEDGRAQAIIWDALMAICRVVVTYSWTNNHKSRHTHIIITDSLLWLYRKLPSNLFVKLIVLETDLVIMWVWEM